MNAFPKYLLIVIASLGLAYLLVSLSGPAYTTATFYHKHYGQAFPVDSLFAAADRNAAVKATLMRAGQRYVDSAYEAALVEVRSAKAAAPQVPAIHFYEGLCLLYLKQGPPAREAFERVMTYDHPLAAPAAWYRALSYVQHNERLAALEALEKIHGAYEARAKALKADLE